MEVKATKEQLDKFYQQIESITDMLANGRAHAMKESINSSPLIHLTEPKTYYENQKAEYIKKIQSDEFGNLYEYHKKKNDPFFQKNLLCDDFTEAEIISGNVRFIDSKPDMKKLINYKMNIAIVNFLNNEINRKPESVLTDWSKLHKDLISNGYIKDVSQADFNDVMNYKTLPNGKNRIIWMTARKNDAYYFQNLFDFKMKQFKKCFIYKNETEFKEPGRIITDPDEKFIDILNIYK